METNQHCSISDLVYLYSHRCLLVPASRDGAILRNIFCCCNRKSLYSVSVATPQRMWLPALLLLHLQCIVKDKPFLTIFCLF